MRDEERDEERNEEREGEGGYSAHACFKLPTFYTYSLGTQILIDNRKSISTFNVCVYSIKNSYVIIII